MKKARYFLITIVLALQISFPLFQTSTAHAAVNTVRPIVFPVLGGGSYTDDFYSPRSGGIHHATDIISSKMREEVAAVDGTITNLVTPEADWGYSVTIRDDDGWNYRYIHMNDDTPGTNDGRGGEMNAYAPDVKVGNRVNAGQHLGYVGDSGYANGVSHLHFEIFDGNGTYIDPFYSLNPATRLYSMNQGPIGPTEFLPYGYRPLGISVAMGNLDGDAASEVITGVGGKGGPHVRTFDDNGQPMGFDQYVFDPNFQGGVDVAAGDVDGDHVDEIITSAGPGAGPHVRVLKMNGQVLAEFYAFDPTFKGGVRVAAADMDGDGKAEIIAAEGPGGEPRVRVFKLDGTLLSDLMVYSQDFKGGVDVAAGDVIGDSKNEIVTASGKGESGFVRVLDVNGNELSRIYAYETTYKGGVRVSVGNVRTSSAKSEIVTVPENDGAPHIAMFNGAGTQILDEDYFMEKWWRGYNDVAAGYDFSRAATGANRRAAVKFGLD
jgi:hypothetical protein